MMKTFENLAQRSMNYFLATMPSFHSVKSELVSVKEQENAYHFIKGIYNTLYHNPEFLGLKIHPDDCLEYWWSKRSDKPGIADKIRGYIKRTNQIIETIYIIVYTGIATGDCITLELKQYEIKNAMIKKLVSLGIRIKRQDEIYNITFPKDTLKGLNLLASISYEYSNKNATMIHNNPATAFLLFSHGIFNPEVPYTAEIFHEIFENKEAYEKLITYFNDKKFTRIDHKEYKIGMHADMMSLDFVKFYGEPEGIIGNAWKTRNFSGIEFSYDELNQDCSRVGIHIPFFREVLENIDKMSPSLRGFIANWNQCMGCRYCVKSDKSKTKPLRFVKVNDKNICSVFTFGYTFNQFYDGLWMADGVIELMEFVDDLFKEKRFAL